MGDVLVTCSAPGKLILFGEHAVVYGHKALSCSISLRTYVSVIQKKTSFPLVYITLELYGHTFMVDLSNLSDFRNKYLSIIESISLDMHYDFDLEIIIKELGQSIGTQLTSTSYLDNRPLNLAVVVFLFLYICIFPPAPLMDLTFSMKSEIPLASGLGSSAAFCVAIAGSLVALKIQENIDLGAVNHWAYVGERFFHGNPSGIDNTICVYGGLLAYKKSWDSMSSSLGSIDMKNIRLEGKVPFHLFIIDSKIKKNTKSAVEFVRILRQKVMRTW